MLHAILIGFGFHGKEYFNQLVYFNNDDVSLDYIITTNKDAENFIEANPFNTRKIILFDSIDKIIINTINDIDLIIIATSPSSHFEIFSKLVMQYTKVKFLIDKPCFIDIKSYEYVISLSNSMPDLLNNIIISLPRRGYNIYNILKEKFQKGILGNILSVSFLWVYSYPIIFKGKRNFNDQSPTKNFRANYNIYNGGAFYDFGSHIFDTLSWILNTSIKDIHIIEKSIEYFDRSNCTISGHFNNNAIFSGLIAASQLYNSTKFRISIFTNINNIYIEDDKYVTIESLDDKEIFTNKQIETIFSLIKNNIYKNSYCTFSEYYDFFKKTYKNIISEKNEENNNGK